MNCDELIEQLSEYLDPDAREELCRQINEHLSHCKNCRVEVDTARKTIQIVQSPQVIDTPVWVSEQLGRQLAMAYEAKAENPGSD